MRYIVFLQIGRCRPLKEDLGTYPRKMKMDGGMDSESLLFVVEFQFSNVIKFASCIYPSANYI